MRKLIGTIALMLFMQTVWAGNVNDVFNEFKKTEHADYVSVSPFLMKLGKLLVKHEDKEAYDIIRHINSVQVLDLEDCSTAVKQRFARSIALLDHDGYETMMRVNDEGEKVNIPFHVAEDPLKAVARGTCIALKHTDKYPFLMR